MTERTILITGGSGVFGSSLVSYFLAAGDRIITTCRTQDSQDKLMTDYARYGEAFVVLKSDLTETDAIKILMGKLGTLDIMPNCLVNNARSADYLKIEENGLVKRENFANEYLLDVIVPYELTMGLMMLKNSKLHRVVNIGSMYGTVAANIHLYTDPDRQSPLHYSVAKAALSHLTKELAVRLSKNKIQVNCIAFGGVEGRVDEEFKERYAKLCPMGRMLTADEVVHPVEMLLSDKCSGITGHTLAVDGGWSIW